MLKKFFWTYLLIWRSLKVALNRSIILKYMYEIVMTTTSNRTYYHKVQDHSLSSKGEIHETLQNCKSLTKRQIQCFNNVSCHGFEFATPYRALPSFVNDPLSSLYANFGTPCI
jgi:hypothetical protein